MDWNEAPAEGESRRKRLLPSPKVGEASRRDRDLRARHRRKGHHQEPGRCRRLRESGRTRQGVESRGGTEGRREVLAADSTVEAGTVARATPWREAAAGVWNCWRDR